VTAGRALTGGLGDVVRAPALIMAALVAMLVIAIPFGAAIGVRLQHSLAHRQPVAQGATEIDANWWQEFSKHAEGVAATFTPSIIGVAAPLDNLSSLLDGRPRQLILMVPVAIAIVAWAFIWSAAFDRFAHGGRSSGLWRAGTRMLVPYVAISMLAAAVVLLLYYTVHPLLFRVLGDRLQMSVVDERFAFGLRLVLYVMFGSLLVAISIIADYARVVLALSPRLSTRSAIAESWRFVRGHAASVVGLYLAAGSLFVLLLAAYSALEIAGDVHVGGWRGIAIAQTYLVARIVVRLTFGASEVRLYRALAPVAPGRPAHVP
jgi:hypothetical protein